MRQKVLGLIEEAKSQFSGYASIYAYRLENVCVKAESAALLSFNVEFEGDEYPIEQMANAWNPREDQYEIVPNDEEYIFPICKGMKEAHPEFEIEVKDPEEGSDNDSKTILVTVPEVDKNRRDTMMDAVDTLSKDIKPRIDAANEEYKVRLDILLIGETKERIDEAKKEYNKLHDTIKDYCKQCREQKEKEIEEAYQRYLEKQKAAERQHQEQQAATNLQAGMSMKLGDNGENDY